MSQSPRLNNIKSLIETFGILAVVVSLFLVWQETQQNRTLAEANFDLMITQNVLLANQTIAAYPSIWLRGCAGDSLSAEEKIIFETMVHNKADLAFFRIIKSMRLKEYNSSTIDFVDFVGFLHRNPGAKAVWSKREETLTFYRKKQYVDHDEFSKKWISDVKVALEKLDQQVPPGSKR